MTMTTTATSKTFLIIRDRPDGERGTETDVLGAFSTLGAAKRARARLNAIRRQKQATLALELIGRDYLKLSRSGATGTWAKHDASSAFVYAGYRLPRIRLVELTLDEEIADEAMSERN